MIDDKKIWLVEHPITQYNEDVKKLAMRHYLKVRDAKFRDEINPDFVEENPPELTLKIVSKSKKK